MKKKGQLKPTLPLIEELQQEQEEFELNHKQSLSFPQFQPQNQYQAMQFIFKNSKLDETQIYGQHTFDDDDDEVDSNISTLPDITTPAGRMQSLQTSEAAQYYSYTQRQCGSISSYKVSKPSSSPKLVASQKQTRVQKELDVQNSQVLSSDRQSFSTNEILSIIAFVTLSLALLFAITTFISPPTLTSFAISQNSNFDRKIKGNYLNLASVQLNNNDCYVANRQYNQNKNNEADNKREYKIFNGLSIINRLISKITELRIDEDNDDSADNEIQDSKREDIGKKDEIGKGGGGGGVGNNAFSQMQHKTGAVLAPFYFETASQCDKQVNQILHKEKQDKVNYQEELNSQYTILIYFLIFVMFPLYCNSFYLYKKMILVAAILKQRKMQEEIKKLQENRKVMIQDNLNQYDKQSVSIKYNRSKIQKRGKKGQVCNLVAKSHRSHQNLSKERLDYHQAMEHIQREAQISDILLSKSEDAATRVKKLSFGKKAAQVIKNNINRDTKLMEQASNSNKRASSDENRMNKNKSQSFSLIVGLANFISLAQRQFDYQLKLQFSDVESYALVYLFIVIVKFFIRGHSLNRSSDTITSKIRKIANIGFCVGNIMMTLYHVNSFFFFNSYI